MPAANRPYPSPIPATFNRCDGSNGPSALMGKGLNAHPWVYNNELLRIGVSKTVVGGTAQALLWYQTARRQRRRIWGKRERDSAVKSVDGHFYAIAVVHAMRGANMVLKQSRDKALEQAVQMFESRNPNYGDVRDILEHWADYAKGKGFLQRSGDVPRKFKAGRRWASNHLTGARDHMINVDTYTLSLETSFDALRDVTRATCAVADRLAKKAAARTKTAKSGRRGGRAQASRPPQPDARILSIKPPA